VTHVQELTHARDHRVFSGKLVRKELRLGERALATAMRVHDGDFRDWDDIRSWASSIADYLGAAG
jgi:menaquinone-dependent protoporphyrinogen oxidase